MDLSTIKNQAREVKREVREKTLGYIVAALGLVAGLAWNEAIKSFIDYLFPLSVNSLWLKFAYAALVTMVVVVASFYLTRTVKLEKE